MKKVIHFYGMTTTFLGFSEEEFVTVNSRPSHAWNECLRRLQRDGGVSCAVYLYSCEGPRRLIDVDGLEWILIPATWGKHYSDRALGKELRKPHLQFSVPFLREVRAHPPDLFVFYGNVPTPFSRILARELRLRRVPYVVTVHTNLANLLRRQRSESVLRRMGSRVLGTLRRGEIPSLFGNASAVILLTEGDRKLAIENRIVTSDRIHVIPSGVNPLYFHPGEAKGKGVFPSLCFVGRLEEAKGFEEAVLCFADVRARFPDARFHVAGTWTSPSYKERLLSLIERRGLENDIRFLGWAGPEELATLYRRSHLLLFPSRQEGLPRAILESMMCGTPAAAVIGTGGHTELIEHGVNGILTRTNEMTGEVLRFLLNPHELERISSNAARTAERGFSLDAMYNKVEALYSSLMIESAP